ncbi:TetR/AcrR family transcriptional regulator [Limimaricola soesokkakensis]|uniref:TetR/AcrR family transcriptional regulator n=1 Tax=Limimaricola soesokkakensis TaxID=1343159 RepID=UPI003515CC7A
MAGLRERQKADRQRRILEAAVAAFRESYRAARIEDLAAKAEVSVGTVYNYYPTKGDILMAVVTMEVEEVLAQGEALVAEPPAGAAQALGALIDGYYDHSLVYLTKEMWRHAMAISIEAAETPNGRHYAALDAKLCDQVTRLLDRLRARGEIAPALPVAELGRIVFNNLNQMFMEFARDEQMTIDTLKRKVAAQTAPLAGLMAV